MWICVCNVDADAVTYRTSPIVTKEQTKIPFLTTSNTILVIVMVIHGKGNIITTSKMTCDLFKFLLKGHFRFGFWPHDKHWPQAPHLFESSTFLKLGRSQS